jgi:type I restriction enzyme, S subunit
VTHDLAIEQLTHRIPPHWRTLPFRRVAALSESANSSSTATLLSLASTGVVAPREEFDGLGRQTPAERTIERYWLANPGDLVVNPMWLVGGGIGVSKVSGAVSPDYRVYRLSPELHSRFVHHLLRSQPYRDQYKLYTRAETTFDRRVSKVDFHAMPILIPPLDEQRRIADFLDAETARIDRLDQLASSALSLLAERRQVLVEQVIGTNDASTWKLFRCLQVLRDGTHQPPPRTAVGVPLLTARNVSSGTLKLTDNDTFVSEEDAEILEASLRPIHRDILFSVKGTIGAVAIVPHEFPRAVLDRNLALLRPMPTLLNEWLVWALRTRKVQEQMRLSIAAAAQPGLPLGVIRELRIPAADTATQKKQVESIEQIDQQLGDLESKIQSQRHLLAERRQAVITAAVTGGITV